MKQVLCRLLSCVFLIAGSNAAMADAYLQPVAEETGSFCLDSMETVPVADDLVPTLISLDGGCSGSQGTISI